MNSKRKFSSCFSPILVLAILFCAANISKAQSYLVDSKRESARSDKLTGGKIERTALVAGNPDIKITINVPAFQMTLWQNGREVKTYPVGVGMKDYPIYVGLREASAVIYNPVWIPPSSDWVEGSKNVKVGEVILPTDSRNPLGKVKIPLGLGYLIHQAKSSADLGSLVSHGCVRVMQPDLYDLAEKITAARALPVTDVQIVNAKTTKETLNLDLAPVVPVEITYDTLVVEAGKLHIYPDVYERKTNTPENLRVELESSGVKTSKISDSTLQKMLAKAAAKKQYVVSIKNIETGKALIGGQVLPIIANSNFVPAKPSRKPARKSFNGVIRERRV